ncbi:hypothetical protein [Mycetocola saprophilus]|uniref:hypothetical protein n=1 Tax=Mycetocola saprophilus TaxID=76636 RepID=UPI0004C05BEE|nr:hypothetical protein [Mycetocola saprophilus]
MKKFTTSAAAAVILIGAMLVPAAAANAADLGGWSEDTGVSSLSSTGFAARAASQAQHTGKAEQKSISGTTHKRAHGWTTWVGVYHYTNAQMEQFGGGKVYTTSGRQWGTNGTEAISPWRKFSQNSDLGSARTYYGK